MTYRVSVGRLGPGEHGNDWLHLSHTRNGYFVRTMSSSSTSYNSRPSSITRLSIGTPFLYQSSHQQPDEFLRACEFLRYHSPPLTPSSPSITPSSLVHSAQRGSLVDQSAPTPLPIEDAPVGGCENLLKSSDDPALLAFSQLLALRLDCERSMVSLIDRKNQSVFISPGLIATNLEIP